MEWISVKDRLPPCNATVLAWCRYFGPHFGCRVVCVGDHGYHELPSLERITAPITHWMPLPPPPKEGE